MNRLMPSIVIAMLGLANAAEACPQGETPQAKSRPNVLFVSVDDLRPEVGCYGNPDIKTPYFDAFAKTGTTFMRAYCQAAVCAPSTSQRDDGTATGLDPSLGFAWKISKEFA